MATVKEWMSREPVKASINDIATTIRTDYAAGGVEHLSTWYQFLAPMIDQSHNPIYLETDGRRSRDWLREGAAMWYPRLEEAVPDLKLSSFDVTVRGDDILVDYELNGTHEGTPVRFAITVILGVRGDEIVSVCGHWKADPSDLKRVQGIVT